MNREIQAVVLLLVGVATLRISLTDTYLDYVKSGMQPWLIGSGVVLVLLGAGALFDVVRGPSDAQHSHGPASAWLLLIPVATIFLVAPPALGAFTAARDTTNSVTPAEDTVEFDPLPVADPVPLTVSEYVSRAVWGEGTTLEGRTVQMTGFVVPSADGGSWQLARMMIGCCAADATSSKVEPKQIPAEFADLKANTWVTITGTYTPSGEAPTSRTVPWITLTSIKETKKPKNPYE